MRKHWRPEFHIPTFGRHNIMNATAVIGLLYIAGFDLDLVREHLKTFAGVKRRPVKNTQVKRLWLFSNHIPLHGPLPCWMNLLKR